MSEVNGVKVQDVNNPTIQELLDVMDSAAHTVSVGLNPMGWHDYHSTRLMLEHLKEADNG